MNIVMGMPPRISIAADFQALLHNLAIHGDCCKPEATMI